MNIQSLKPAENSRFSQKRLGRGIGSGIGKTSGKGHKGQNARSGGGVRVGFEGGQMPLVRKLPRRGFNNSYFKKQYSIVNVSDLNKFDENSVVDANTLIEKGILSKVEEYGVKILGNGKLEKALTVKANKFSESAIKKIKKANGTIEEV
ncbi:MAG: 50S ribosomal protein L15 [Clostridia bacterium]|nr:50S ribosomal protein L15 [Clostridia bacterium]MBQ9792628.1 50S ribosomal protein L15 [Clostridia bacterium]